MKITHKNALGEMQTIKEHLIGTAGKAERFAAAFACGDIGYLCGLMHDIGKYSDAFQQRISDPEHVKKVDHSTAGAKELLKCSPEYIPLAMVVAGHHSGLLDGGSRKFSEAHDGTFFGRLKNEIPEYEEWKEEIVPGEVRLPSFCLEGNRPGFTMSFFIRMIYSCLVDADYLDTEEFVNCEISKRKSGASVSELLERFENYITGWVHRSEFDSLEHELLCRRRTKILLNCMEQGSRLERGLYTLTVPTGGGKTTASLGFALRQAQKHQMERIIYVIPYTSVIDQNAEVFSKILGEENVLEHHSGVLYEMTEDQMQNETVYRKVLATENWDMPVVVTTAVQFFESLFANKSSKCRKLHNIANSVIILDEAQTLPVFYLEPCVAAMAELVAHYKSSVVLCTATQPALGEVFKKYLPDTDMAEICDEVEELYQQFRRTQIRDVGTITMDDLCEKLTEREQFLCVVNRRKTAQELYESVEGEGKYCLTTLLYPASRKEKIAEIKERLAKGKPCRVIATSLIEAGVDLDFPEVYRQEAGLDSVIQAAGRCNREGRRPVENSIVSVFRLEGSSSPFLAQNIAALREAQRNLMQEKDADLAGLDVISFYFRFYRELLGEENLDGKEIMKAFEKGIDGNIFPFAAVAKKFLLIENETTTVYIPVGEGKALVEQLVTGQTDRSLFRKLGQYSVNVYPNHLRALLESGCLERLDDTVYILRDLTQYREDTGLQKDVETGSGFFV